MKSKRFLVSIAGATVVCALSAGIAYAVWSASGAGSGAGAGAVAQSLTINPMTPANGTMYPGGPAGAVYFTVTNPNPYPVTITGVTWGTPVSYNTSVCPSLNVTLDSGAPTTVSLAVPANGTSALMSIPGVLDLAHTAPPGCQGNGFGETFTVTGAQQ